MIKVLEVRRSVSGGVSMLDLERQSAKTALNNKVRELFDTSTTYDPAFDQFNMTARLTVVTGAPSTSTDEELATAKTYLERMLPAIEREIKRREEAKQKTYQVKAGVQPSTRIKDLHEAVEADETTTVSWSRVPYSTDKGLVITTTVQVKDGSGAAGEACRVVRDRMESRGVQIGACLPREVQGS